jgi:hypothetical protein
MRRMKLGFTAKAQRSQKDAEEEICESDGCPMIDE